MNSTMKRKFFFLKDSVTGNFYTDSAAEVLVSFDKAEMYFQRKNAEKILKELVNERYSSSWGWYVKNLPKYLTIRNVYWNKKRINKIEKMIDERKDLPNWGIEIVEVEVDAP